MDVNAEIPAQGSKASRLTLERQLCFALYSTSLVMTKLYRPLLEPAFRRRHPERRHPIEHLCCLPGYFTADFPH